MAEKTTIKFFVASAGEVKEERKEAIVALDDLGNSHPHLHLKPIEWEYSIPKGNFPDHDTIQDGINPKLEESQIVIFIFYSCIRPNTLLEFKYATEMGKKIFAYFKPGFSPSNKDAIKAWTELIEFRESLNNTVLQAEFEDTEGFHDLLYRNINLYLSENYSANKAVETLSKDNQQLIQMLAEKEKEIKELKGKPLLQPNNEATKQLKKLVREKEAITNELLQSEEVRKQQAKEKEQLEKQLASQKEKDVLKAKALKEVEKGNYMEAEAYLKKSARDSIIETAATFYELAKIKKLQFKYEEALGFYELGIKIDPNTSIFLYEAGALCDDLGYYDKAIEYYKNALETDRIDHGEETLRIAAGYNNIGLSFYKKGDYEKAIEYYEKSLFLDRKFYGQEHPTIATSYNNLGLAYYKKGDYNKAIAHYESALEIDKKFHGEEHPHIAVDYNNLGLIYNSKGEYNKAIQYYKKTVKINKKFHGEEHPDIATAYSNLGLAYHNKEEYDKAIEFYEKALAIDKKFYGEEHPHIATRYSNLGSTYNSKGVNEKAIKFHEKALSIDKKFYGEEHPDIAIDYSNLALIYIDNREYDKAIEYYEKALTIGKKFLGGEHPSIAIRYNNLAMCYLGKHEYEKAVDYYQKSLSCFQKFLESNHPNILTAKKNLAFAQSKLTKK